MNTRTLTNNELATLIELLTPSTCQAIRVEAERKFGVTFQDAMKQLKSKFEINAPAIEVGPDFAALQTALEGELESSILVSQDYNWFDFFDRDNKNEHFQRVSWEKASDGTYYWRPGGFRQHGFRGYVRSPEVYAALSKLGMLIS
jgi:hypothetical protein